ncbi:MAG: 23S rRNA (pseudouridine(1915)-N(3))-methyltransferase RlmH [Thiohalomonadaceae bacterium]
MRIHLIAVGERMPAWVQAGYAEYAKRLPPECALRLVEIAPGKRTKGADVARLVAEEGERILAAIPKGALVVALEVKGQPWSTEDLSRRLGEWMQGGRDVALLVGGPDGLDARCRARADLQWSLSPLTLPHPLVRVVLAEQIYRAHSLLRGHPYHR